MLRFSILLEPLGDLVRAQTRPELIAMMPDCLRLENFFILVYWEV